MGNDVKTAIDHGEGAHNDPWEEAGDAPEPSASYTYLTRGSVLAGKYEITQMLGRGGMGAVYEAEQLPFRRVVAIKVLPKSAASDEQARARFEREARLIMRLDHPHVVTVHDFGELDNGLSFLVMERLRGRSLSSELGGAFDPHRAVRIVRQICQALRAAHREGIVHRDLKPANIHLIELDGEVDFVKLFDFGIAKLTAPNADVPITTAGTIGTPRYMAPEQALGPDAKLDHRADIYALGCIAYELLSGRPPFIDPSYAPLLYKHLHERPPSFAEIRADLTIDSVLEEIIRKALEKRPEDRFHSAEEMEAALDLWASTSSTERAPSLPRTEVLPPVPAPVEPERTEPETLAPPRPRAALRPHRALFFATGAALVVIGFSLTSSWPEDQVEMTPADVVAPKVVAQQPVEVAPVEVAQVDVRPAEEKARTSPVKVHSIDISSSSADSAQIEAAIAAREKDLVRCFNKHIKGAAVQLRFLASAGTQTVHVSGRTPGAEYFLACVRDLNMILPLPRNEAVHVVSVVVGSRAGGA
jgi:serine/threonine-protein kinase